MVIVKRFKLEYASGGVLRYSIRFRWDRAYQIFVDNAYEDIGRHYKPEWEAWSEFFGDLASAEAKMRNRVVGQ